MKCYSALEPKKKNKNKNNNNNIATKDMSSGNNINYITK